MAQLITSLQNSHFKAATKLQRSRERKRQGRIIIYGRREIERAIQGHVEIVELFTRESDSPTGDNKQIETVAEAGGADIFQLPDNLFDKLSYGDRSDGVVAVAIRPKTELARLTAGDQQLVVVLESIEKPGNIGAVVRTAAAAGASCVILANPVTDVFHPNAIRAAMGLCFTMNVATERSQTVLSWLIENQFSVHPTLVDAEKSYADQRYSERTAIVLGSEANGLDQIWTHDKTQPITIPMNQSADSLNISVTAGIVLFEVARQRHGHDVD